MYIAHCYNWSAGDDFMTVGETESEAINALSKAYQKYYDMSYEDVVDEHGDDYESFEEYLSEYKEMYVYKLVPGEISINHRIYKEIEV